MFEGVIEQRRFRGWVLVDSRKMKARDVIEMAQSILDAELIRNNELRQRYGLPALLRKKIK